MDREAASSPNEDADQGLRDARSRFIAGFTQRHAAMDALLAGFPSNHDHATLTSLREQAHKLAGLAGVLGFPTVSKHAATLEHTLLQTPEDIDNARTP